MCRQTKTIVFLLLLWSSSMIYSCSGDKGLDQPSIEMEIPSAGFQVEVGKPISLQANFLNAEGAAISWEIDGTVISTNQSLIFTPSNVGNYSAVVKATTANGSDSKAFQIKVTTTHSPYITGVFEYVYAPGQHASLIPANATASSFIGEPWTQDKSFTYLGGWGGFIIAGFDHAVNNSDGADFCVYTQPGAASEPGVIFVMDDSNNDGLPNDTWYELKGSEFNHSETIRDYSLTYFKPQSSGKVTWSDNKGNSGELNPVFQSDTWWWSGYGDKNSVTFTGTRLPNAYINDSQTETENWVIRNGLFLNGYAECYSNNDYNSTLKANLLDISNAVDADGNPVQLNAIRFIKVQSGVFQIAGWLNEISTEVSGAADLHLIDKDSY